MKNILVTGSKGFIGKNTTCILSRVESVNIIEFHHESTEEDLKSALDKADFIIHLAGVNRPKSDSEFMEENLGLTKRICEVLETLKKSTPIIFSSSIHVERDNLYGESKKMAEEALREYGEKNNAPIFVYRFPHVVGKWCRPNYNSVVATFCHNIARDLPIEIHDENYAFDFVYIDDVVESFLDIIKSDHENKFRFCQVDPSYNLSIGELSQILKSFKDNRTELFTEKVGKGMLRALYSTYISYLPTKDFSYPVKQYADERGFFVEFLKTKESGQFSFFTAKPGITRGGHYHHTKVEKFLVINGKAKFRFKNISTGEYYDVETNGKNSQIVETIPGWTHDITNIGDDELFCILWANEVFDRDKPDTYSSPL